MVAPTQAGNPVTRYHQTFPPMSALSCSLSCCGRTWMRTRTPKMSANEIPRPASLHRSRFSSVGGDSSFLLYPSHLRAMRPNDASTAPMNQNRSRALIRSASILPFLVPLAGRREVPYDFEQGCFSFLVSAKKLLVDFPLSPVECRNGLFVVSYVGRYEARFWRHPRPPIAFPGGPSRW